MVRGKREVGEPLEVVAEVFPLDSGHDRRIKRKW